MQNRPLGGLVYTDGKGSVFYRQKILYLTERGRWMTWLWWMKSPKFCGNFFPTLLLTFFDHKRCQKRSKKASLIIYDDTFCNHQSSNESVRVNKQRTSSALWEQQIAKKATYFLVLKNSVFPPSRLLLCNELFVL